MAAIFKLPVVRPASTRLRSSPLFESFDCWLKGSGTSKGSAGAVCLFSWAAAFLAALALAMLSLRAFDDFVFFLASASDCCSAVRSCVGEAVDAIDDFLDPVDVGERRLRDGLDGTFRVFFTWSVREAVSVFDSVDCADFTLNVRRGVVELVEPAVFGGAP